jgi:hypothetical protein
VAFPVYPLWLLIAEAILKTVKREKRQMETFTQLYKDACKADDAWSAELVKLYGKRAGDMRYTKEGKGSEGSELRRLHDAWSERRDALSAYYMSREACG